jgi:DinB family protein
MKRIILSSALLLLSLSAGAVSAFSQIATPSAAAPADNTPPSYDMKPQSLLDLEGVQKKFIALAGAIPANTLTWRPAPDARSFAEVFLHVSGERYGFLGLMDTPPPAGFDGKTFEKSTTDRARIVEELNKSWDFTKTAINGMTNADFAKPLPKLGPQANAGDVIYLLVADAHEHLGQLVAYARANGIVPPWTVEAQKAAAEKKAK